MSLQHVDERVVILVLVFARLTHRSYVPFELCSPREAAAWASSRGSSTSASSNQETRTGGAAFQRLGVHGTGIRSGNDQRLLPAGQIDVVVAAVAEVGGRPHHSPYSFTVAVAVPGQRQLLGPDGDDDCVSFPEEARPPGGRADPAEADRIQLDLFAAHSAHRSVEEVHLPDEVRDLDVDGRL